ncbi:MAG: serine hydrolase domain-containing protein [Anaerolineales bacterium]
MNFDGDIFAQWVNEQRENDPFHGVVHLSRGDEVLFAGAYGDAIRSESIPNRPHTRFQTASGSKIFTSVAVCQLLERGLLTPQTPLSECLDVDFPHFDPGVTVHHLLTHTSGIPDYFDEETMDDYEALWQTLPTYTLRSPSDFLPLFYDRPMKLAPGERFSYNNAGFVLLGLIVEQLTGQRFTDYVEEHVFARAGMQDSGYFWMDRLPERTAYAYIEGPDGTWRTNFFAVPIVGGGDGGAYTTAPDMVRFWQALQERRLLGEEVTELLLTPHVATGWEAPYTHYGYGVWIHPDERGVQRWFVVGGDPGVSFQSSYFPGEEVVLTFMGNAGETLWSFAGALEERLEL